MNRFRAFSRATITTIAAVTVATMGGVGVLIAQGAVAVAAPDTTPPNPVATIKVSTSTSAIKLDWASNKEKDLKGYNVYRSTSASGPFTKLTSSPRSSSDYTDKATPVAVIEYYRVTAVDKSGNESAPTAASGMKKDKIAPAAPTGVTLTLSNGVAVVSWTPNTEPDLAGYLVARATSAGGTYTVLTPTPITTTSYTDNSGSATAFYRVAAVDTSGNKSSYTKVTVPDTTAPSAVTGLKVTVRSTSINLSWSSSTASDKAGYWIYRATSATGPFTKLNTTLRTSPSYSDTTAATGVQYWYQVTVVDQAGNESGPAAVSAIRTDAVAPAAPAGLTAATSASGVVLAWTPNTEPDLAGYQVARADSAAGAFTTLATVTSATYTDSPAPTTAVFYRVTAVDQSGNVSTPTTVQYQPPATVPGANVIVAADGTGDFTTVAAALAAAPNDATAWVIGIRAGTYHELLTISRANVTLVGATGNAADVRITYDNASKTINPATGLPYGTSGSASVLIKSSNVTVKNLTIANDYVETGVGDEMAVALKTTGDRLMFDNVRLIGNQDTLYADSPAPGAQARSYYHNSYIEGDVDFIFGRGTAVFDGCTLNALSRGSATNNGFITAASTNVAQKYGFLVTDSTVTSNAPANSFSLGRPWQPSGDANAIAQVVFRNTALPSAINVAQPWANMTSTFDWHNARFDEFHNTGAGAGVNANRPQLTTVQAAQYTKWTYLAGTDNWNPTGQQPPADTTAPAAPTGLTVTGGDSMATLAWTASTDADVAGYNVYRSTDATVTISASTLIAADLTPTTTGYVDKGLTPGTTYHYAVTAFDATGNESALSTTASATPTGVVLPAHDLVVAADGSGNYTTVQAAINAATAGTAAKPFVIVIKPGTYHELVSLTKSYVQLVGATGVASDVVLDYNNAAGTTNPATGQAYGTGNSMSVLVTGSNVTMKDLTIQNSFDEAASTFTSNQAVALRTTGDRNVYENVRLLGNQDTLLADSPNPSVIARAYFHNSLIQGDVDFIFGRGTVVFDNCTLNALSRGSTSNNGYLTAASTSDKNPHGFLIINSTVTSNAPANTFSLGRAWEGWSDGYTVGGVVYNSRAQVTFANTSLPAAIRVAQPWADMAPLAWTDGRFSEYQNTGDGAAIPNAATRPQAAAAPTIADYLAGSDGWSPQG